MVLSPTPLKDLLRPIPNEFDALLTSLDSQWIDEVSLNVEPDADPLEHAQRALYVALVAIPAIAGLDKFAGITADWTHYLSPFVLDAAGTSASQFVKAVGVIEISFAIAIAIRPKTAPFIFMAYLALVCANLVMLGNHLHIVFHDLGLMAGAYALGKLSITRDTHFFEPRTRLTGASI